MDDDFKIRAWKKLVELGAAGKACDVYVREYLKEKPIPPRLLRALGKAKTIRDSDHGQYTGYKVFDCRCEKCKAWQSDQMKRYHQRRKERDG